jgi:hypothetical protein
VLKNPHDANRDLTEGPFYVFTQPRPAADGNRAEISHCSEAMTRYTFTDKSGSIHVSYIGRGTGLEPSPSNKSRSGIDPAGFVNQRKQLQYLWH